MSVQLLTQDVLTRRAPKSSLVQTCSSKYCAKFQAVEQTQSEIKFTVTLPSRSMLVDAASVKITVPLRLAYAHRAKYFPSRVPIADHTSRINNAPGDGNNGTVDVRTAGSNIDAIATAATQTRSDTYSLPGDPNFFINNCVKNVSFTMGGTSLQYANENQELKIWSLMTGDCDVAKRYQMPYARSDKKRLASKAAGGISAGKFFGVVNNAAGDDTESIGGQNDCIWAYSDEVSQAMHEAEKLVSEDFTKN